jgi:hydroxymethylpyrimidine/phosphomethylpyrimidine kinase
MPKHYTPTVLTIAGSDPCGGAGIQIDCKTIHALDGYAFSVTTALTAQNSQGVLSVQSTESEMFKLQLETLLDDVHVDAVKIGMLANAEIISVVAESIDKYDLKNIILDTVLLSSSGKVLLEPKAIDVMVKELFPRVDLITPNLPEINTFLQTSYVGDEDEVRDIAAIASHLAKGENLKNSVAYAKDFLYKNLLTASEINFNYVDPNAIRKEPIL